MTDNGAPFTIDELPDIPDSWQWGRLGDLVDQSRGICYGIVQPGKHDESGVPMVNSQDVLDGTVASRIEFRVAKELHAQFKRSTIRGGEVLLTLVGANFGRVAIAPSSFAGFNCSRAVGIIPVREHPQFVMFCLRAPLTRRFLDNWANTTAQPTFNLKEVANLPIPLPPLAEQKAIAAVLGALDDKIELNRRMNATLEAMARALFQSWFVDFDPVRTKLDGRQPFGLDTATAALFPAEFQDSYLGKIPRGWSIRALDEVLDVRHGFAFAGEYFRDEPVGDILLTPGNFSVGGGFKDYKLKHYDGPVPDEYVLREHDLILTMTDLSKASDTLGYPAMIPAALSSRRYLHNQRLGKVVITKPNLVNGLFLYHVFCSEAYRHEILASATGTTVKHTSPSRIKAFRTVFPPPPLMSLFERIILPCCVRALKNREQSRTLATLRDTLLPKLLSGELSVRNLPILSKVDRMDVVESVTGE